MFATNYDIYLRPLSTKDGHYSSLIQYKECGGM